MSHLIDCATRIARFALAVAIATLTLFFAAGEGVAKNQALLVGVSTYTGSANTQLSNLPGTRNDVTQLWRYLTASGFAAQDVAVLADGIPEGDVFPKPVEPPTYKAIIRQLEKLAAAKYQPGDIVVFYFSGHGVTSPDDNPDEETDPEAQGRDQVLLPADSGMFFADTRRIENGLVDDEIGDYLTRIRKQGATVWAIIDSCFAGSATRGGDISKSVDPAVLGVPTGSLPEVERRGADAKGPIDMASTVQVPGQLIGFYAVDEFTEALMRPFAFAEYQGPVIAEGGRTEMSVFTYHLLQALNQSDAQSYRELFQQVIAAMALSPENAGVGRPTADGDLDLPIVGRGAADASRVRALVEGDRITIPAGSLQGFAEGAGVTLFGPGKDRVPLATASITSATAVTSVAENIAWKKGVEPPKTASLPVQVTEPVAQSIYAVARPAAASDPKAAAVVQMLDQTFLSEDAQRKYGVSLVAPEDETANLVIKVEAGQIWLIKQGHSFVKEERSFGKTPSIDLSGSHQEILEALTDSIWRLARAERLIRVAEAATWPEVDEQDLALSIGRFREDRLSTPGRDVCPARKPLSTQEASRLLDVTGQPNVSAGNCDVFRISLANNADATSYHVAAFYVDARGGVTALRTISQNAIGCGYLLAEETEKPLVFDIQAKTWDQKADKPATVGAEHIVVLAVERDANEAMPPFCSLSQKSAPDTVRTRGGTSVEDLFGDITGGTRGGGLAKTRSLKTQGFRMDVYLAP